MPFWKKKDPASKTSLIPSRSNSLKSHKSNSKDSKLKIDTLTLNDEESGNKENNIQRPATLKKRVSTIVENIDDLSDNSESESVSESDSDSDSDSTSTSLDDIDDIDDYLHIHKIRKSPFKESLVKKFNKWKLLSKTQLKSIDNESANTFSLLDDQNKIHPLNSKFNNNDSVISEHQIELIESLKQKLSTILDTNDFSNITTGKTLLQRYGNVARVIGRGAYGLIKIIQPISESNQYKNVPNTTLYAVKEILKRKDEPRNTFIDRVISEFIISSTLNNKHITKTVDLMITLSEVLNDCKLCQVMECTPGGDLHSYLTTNIDNNDKRISFMSMEEMDCFLKQISKGLYYMHQHGIAHCDLKLENILISYKNDKLSTDNNTSKIILKIADFGKATVLRTQWEESCQLTCSTNGPIGSEPYMAPEEHSRDPKVNYSLFQKDNWSFGIIMLVLFNIRKRYYSNVRSVYDGEERAEEDCGGYIWSCTDLKSLSGSKKYKDEVFNEYMKTYMVADYDSHTKDWLIKRKGSFKPIEMLFVLDEFENESTELAQTHEVDDLSELRRLIIYKLLDPNHTTRLTINELLKSDWMSSVESCS